MNNEMTHWGIKGMRWGIRRYQNKDGSLTALGMKRRTSDDLSSPKTVAKRKKKISELTNEEIQERINRLQLEKKYIELLNERVPKKETKEVKKGSGGVRKFLAESGKKILVDTSVDIASQAAKHLIAKAANKSLGGEYTYANNKKK